MPGCLRVIDVDELGWGDIAGAARSGTAGDGVMAQPAQQAVAYARAMAAVSASRKIRTLTFQAQVAVPMREPEVLELLAAAARTATQSA